MTQSEIVQASLTKVATDSVGHDKEALLGLAARVAAMAGKGLWGLGKGVLSRTAGKAAVGNIPRAMGKGAIDGIKSGWKHGLSGANAGKWRTAKGMAMAAPDKSWVSRFMGNRLQASGAGAAARPDTWASQSWAQRLAGNPMSTYGMYSAFNNANHALDVNNAYADGIGDFAASVQGSPVKALGLSMAKPEYVQDNLREKLNILGVGYGNQAADTFMKSHLRNQSGQSPTWNAAGDAVGRTAGAFF